MKSNKKEIFIFLILIIIFSMSIVSKNFQNDTFFTIAVGEKILEQGIYTEETFTWHEGLEYANVRWLFDIMITKIYHLGDFLGIYIFVMVMTAVIGVTLFYVFIKKDIHVFLSFLLTVVTMYLGRGMFCARAQIVSFWLFILEAFFIEKLLENGRKKYTILLFIIGVFIANIHASVYPMFFVLFLPYIAEWIFTKLKLKQNEESKIIIEKRHNIKMLCITMLICVFSGLCTPIGLMPYIDMFKTVGAISSNVISEMQPIMPVYALEFMYIFIVIIGILTFSKTKIRLTDAFYLLGFMLISLSTRRSFYFLLFIGMSSVSNIMNDFLKEYKIEGWNFSKETKLVGITIISVIFISISLSNFYQKVNVDYVDTAEYPVHATQYILKNIDIETMRLYNGFNIGSYLEFYGIPVFMDSRAEIYLEEFNNTTILEDFSKISSGSTHYNNIFDEYEVTHAILYSTEIMNIYMSEDDNWEKIYQDDAFSIYEKIDN